MDETAAIKGASMSNRTLIIAVIKRAYGEEKAMLDILIERFRLGENTEFLLGHLLLVAVDQTSFDRCNPLRLHCYKLVTDMVDFTLEKLYMLGDFIKMMWRRTIFLADVLRRGYNFIFTVSQ
ncbi:uncharacterized protein At1g28695-like [Magnolia sinica]|uniref:uncharacterized protein At1g28695-like n=1 Tax=Magnolia sinica TaxID=86752 RepID=UPI00265B08E4|nr:uncharacterized protein At1g28695-like [Magnolia sinica]